MTDETVWPGDGMRPQPSSPVMMTVQSDDADDTAGGSGLESVRITCLDGFYVEFTEDLAMDGLTPVAMTSPCFRVQEMTGLVATESNEGAVTLTDNTQTVIYELIGVEAGVGDGRSHSLTFTVPDGMVAVAATVRMFPGNDHVRVAIRSKVPGMARQTETFSINGIPFFFPSDECLPEHTDLDGVARNGSGAASGVSLEMTASVVLAEGTGICP